MIEWVVLCASAFMRFLSEVVSAHIKHIQGDLLSQFCVVNVSLAPALGSPTQPAFLGHLAVGQHIHLLGTATHTKSGQFWVANICYNIKIWSCRGDLVRILLLYHGSLPKSLGPAPSCLPITDIHLNVRHAHKVWPILQNFATKKDK